MWFTDPCSEKGNCLVRPTCRLLHKTPWERTDLCPAYKEWNKRDWQIIHAKQFISGLVGMGTIIVIGAWIIFTFGLGIWEEFKFIKGLF